MEKTEFFYSIGLEKEKLFSDSKVLDSELMRSSKLTSFDSKALEKFQNQLILISCATVFKLRIQF